MNTKRQAKKGGEIGANGEMYKGGQFIATTAHAKGSRKIKKTGKQKISNTEWAIPENGMWSIFDRITTAAIDWNTYRNEGKIELGLTDTQRYYTNSTDLVLSNLWNKGQRFLPIDQMIEMGVFMPPMYLTDEQLKKQSV